MAYRTEAYLDDKGNEVEKDKATTLRVTIYDDYDKPLKTFLFKLK